MVDFEGSAQQSIDPIKGFKALEGAIEAGMLNLTDYYRKYTNTTLRRSTDRMQYELQLLKDKGLDHMIPGQRPNTGGVLAEGDDEQSNGPISGTDGDTSDRVPDED
ncbi:hypothetical protein ACH42_06360 [Endozoicomonas sp. (ex Bugula neritina AB1)]|nr:hypothetical protein ACH42_06360 [Endozoicomonas sp. (ex Bugula neritina AB1)]